MFRGGRRLESFWFPSELRCPFKSSYLGVGIPPDVPSPALLGARELIMSPAPVLCCSVGVGGGHVEDVLIVRFVLTKL